MLVAFASPAEFLTMFTPDKNFRAIDPRVRIGHVHLKISDLERSLAFYCGVLGFELTQRWETEAAFALLGHAVTFCIVSQSP